MKIEINIQISTEGEIDTGLTVEQWNALTDAERGKIAQNAWEDEAAGHDDGGIWVTTDGATGV